MRRVIAYSTPARFLRSDDYPYGWDDQTFALFLRLIEDEGLAGPEALSILAPSMTNDHEFADFTARVLRSGSTPRQVRDCFETYAKTDIRSVLPSIMVPVLVLHRTGDRLFAIDQSRDLAARLPNAHFVESQATIGHRGQVTSIHSSQRSKRSLPGRARQVNRIASWRPFSSPTSSVQQRRLR
jgi:pimeloyl-ACP methyl ester carboxylesterase